MESLNNKSTPSSPSSAILLNSMSGPIGVRSTLKSPVETILPSLVSMTTPKESGIEWVTLKKEISKSPILNFDWLLYSTNLT